MNAKNHHTFKIIRSGTYVVLIITLFLLSIDLLVNALSHISSDVIQSALSVTTNPFISLFIGLLITALIQSSSTTTSMIVAMVASGSLDIARAIPMVMGANIGTTLTSNIISLSFINKKNEFKNAMAAATVHDNFNILVTLILFPLQYYYNFLGIIAERFTHLITFQDTEAGVNHTTLYIFQNTPITRFIIGTIHNYYLVLCLAVILLFYSIKQLSQLIYRILIGEARMDFENYVFKNPYKSFGWGTLLTACIQSSSVTTSLIVPLVATSRVKLKNAFPFIMGANIGTTITAMLAAMFKSEAAISIAMAHFIFNMIGVIIFLPFPPIKRIPVLIAEWLGGLVMDHKFVSIIYIIVIFFLVPFAFIYLTK